MLSTLALPRMSEVGRVAVVKVEAAERVITDQRAMLEDARLPFWRQWISNRGRLEEGQRVQNSVRQH
jgi:hypothetical protein